MTERTGDPEALAPSGGRGQRILNALLRVESLLSRMVELLESPPRAAPAPSRPAAAPARPAAATAPARYSPSIRRPNPMAAPQRSARPASAPRREAGPIQLVEVPEDWMDEAALDETVPFGKFRGHTWRDVARTQEHYLWFLVHSAVTQFGTNDPQAWDQRSSYPAQLAAWILQWRMV